MVPQSQLACRAHWYSLPQDLRNQIWASYRTNDTVRHAELVRDAVSFLNARETAR